LWADEDPLFNFYVPEIWKLSVQVKETFTTSVQDFHTVHTPKFYG